MDETTQKRTRRVPKVGTAGCIGVGACAGVCPEVFKMYTDEAGELKAKVIEMDDHMKFEEEINEAIEACPVDVIWWEDEDISVIPAQAGIQKEESESTSTSSAAADQEEGHEPPSLSSSSPIEDPGKN